MNNKSGLVWRIVLTIAMGLATTMTLLGGVGTACLAWNAQFYGAAFKWLVPYMPTYQMLVYVSLLTAVVMTLVCYAIVRGDRWFYIGGIVTLIVGGGAAAVQMYYTSNLKNVGFLQTAPTNVRFFLSVGALVVFLIVRIPGIWNTLNSGSASGRGNLGAPAGMAMIVAGLAMLTTPLWAGASHMVDDVNLVLTLQVPLVIDSIMLIIGGTCLMFAQRVFMLVRTRRTVAVSE